MVNKGQAAMEFLMTYGWALLIVLVAIGVLATMGVFSGSKIAATVCILQPAFSCEAVVVANGVGSVSIQLQQGLGTNLDNFQLSLSNMRKGGNICGTGSSAVLTPGGTGWTFNDGSSQTFAGDTCSLTSQAGTRFTADLVVAYAQNGISHKKVGQLRLNIEAA